MGPGLLSLELVHRDLEEMHILSCVRDGQLQLRAGDCVPTSPRASTTSSLKGYTTLGLCVCGEYEEMRGLSGDSVA